jgi:glycosylphosphatidylinositol transamidase (GPIT) subunit GPI8
LIGAAGQKAFVFSSSVGYYNYRQNANALKVYALLKANGVGDEDIILGFPENVGCCGKNPLQGVVSFYDNDHENLNRNIEVDLKFSAISVGSVVDALRMKYSPWTFNLHRTALGDEPYLVYLAGHGGDYYFKIRERQALVSQHFEHLFQDLTVRHPQSSVLLLIDSCSAITPFENVN